VTETEGESIGRDRTMNEITMFEQMKVFDHLRPTAQVAVKCAPMPANFVVS